jgi:hypothetical protein
LPFLLFLKSDSLSEGCCICGVLSTYCNHYTQHSIFGDKKSHNAEEFKRYHLVHIFKLCDGFMQSCIH